jgi:hypothetical protein
MSRPHLAHLTSALALVSVLALVACAPKKGLSPEPPPPPPTYAKRVLERVKTASDREVHALRFNPNICGCPPFEIRLDGRWQRLTFDVADDGHPVLVALREAVEADEQAGQLGTYTIQGRLLDRVTTCGQGALFVTLDPSAFGPPEVEEDSEPEQPDGEDGEPALGPELDWDFEPDS